MSTSGVIGSYYIGGTLGRGSYAKVIQARNMNTNERVAIKMMDRRFIERENVVEYVKKEISVMWSLKHPNIVALKDVLLTKSHIYLVLELIQGNELFEQVAKSGALQEQTARHYFNQLISAARPDRRPVEYCHQHGVCHRDLKLENVVVDSSGHLKILDFGFSRHLDSFLKTPVGTPTYIAPEALSGQSYEGRAVDVWAMGVMLYVMVVGQYPFGDPNTNMGQLYTRIRAAQYNAIPPHVSPACQDLVARIMQADPRARITLEGLRAHPWVQGASAMPAPGPVPTFADASPMVELPLDLTGFAWPTVELQEPMEVSTDVPNSNAAEVEEFSDGAPEELADEGWWDADSK
eukprot:tig00001249_g7783.t1